MKQIAAVLLLALTLSAEEPKPALEQALAEVAALKADLALIEAKTGWCAQELQLWNNIPVMETRLKLAIESRKAEERKQALAARTKATPAPTLAAKDKE